jgi:hypothetical protein
MRRDAEKHREKDEKSASDASASAPAWPLAAGDLDRLVLGRLRGPGAGTLMLPLQQGVGNRAVGALLRQSTARDHEEDEELVRLSAGVQRLAAGSLPDRGVVRQATEAAIGRQIAAIQREEGEETGGAVALQSAPGGGGAGAGGATFNHTSSTVTINADSAPDFSSRITATIGTPHTEIELLPDVQYDFKTGPDGKEVPGSQKITSVGVTVNTKIVKVRFGTGRPNDKHKKAIDEMVAAIEAHEAEHRAIVVAAANAAVKKAQKLVGTSKVKAAFKILDADLDCAAAKGHEALDAKEGLLTAVEQANGDVSITKSASGAKYPCGAAAKSP